MARRKFDRLRVPVRRPTHVNFMTHKIRAARTALTHADVSGRCVDRIASGAEDSWPEIVALVGPLVGDAAAGLDAPDAWLDFGLAAMAVHIQVAAEALLPHEAARARTLILSQVCASLGPPCRQAVERYDRAWNESLTTGGAPLDCVACLLCERWGISCAGSRVRRPQQDPLVVMVLGTALLTWATAGRR